MSVNEEKAGVRAVHFMGRIDQEAGRGACGLRLAEHAHTTGAAGVTCVTYMQTNEWREAAAKAGKAAAAAVHEKKGPPKMRREMEIVIHGAHRVGKTVVQALDPFFVTIDTSVFPSQRMAAELKASGEARPVHFDFGAGFAICCTGMRGSDERTQNLSRVTCVECLRHKVRMQEEDCARLRGETHRAIEDEIRTRNEKIDRLEKALADSQDEANRERASAIKHAAEAAASAAHAERLEAENNRLEEAGIVLSAAVKHVSRALAAFADPIKLLRSKGGEK